MKIITNFLFFLLLIGIMSPIVFYEAQSYRKIKLEYDESQIIFEQRKKEHEEWLREIVK